MTLLQLLVFIIVLTIIASLAYWVITKFGSGFPQATPWILALVGLLLLVVLLAQFLPEAASFRVWK